MRRLAPILFTLVMFLGSIPLVPNDAYGQKDVCFNNLIKHDMCAEAKKVQAEIAPQLPQRISKEMVLRTVVSNQNIVQLNVNLLYNRELLDRSIISNAKIKLLSYFSFVSCIKILILFNLS